MNERLINTVIMQIQRVISEAINTQVLPQIQNTFRQVQGASVGIEISWQWTNEGKVPHFQKF